MAREKIASIPDHTKYFSDKIEEAYESNAVRVRSFESQTEWKAALEKMQQSGEVSEGMFNLLGRMWGDYGEVRSDNLGMLGHIPSAESVKVLGHYLRKREESDIRIHSPDTGCPAAESLTELISDGPLQTWQASADDVPKWQQWFDEVKAGKRTFRFVGSSLEYTLDGPADAATLKRIKGAGSSAPRPNIRNNPATAADGPAGIDQEGPVFHIGCLAAILSCLAAIIYYIRRRKVA
jgi:hypothetical protein